VIERTKKKLRELQFFLGKLQSESQTPSPNEPEATEFYLSAFLSAARSVTFALQYEEKDKYDNWFPSWREQRSADERELLDFLKAQRNNAQKRGHAEVTPDWQYIPVTKARWQQGADPGYEVRWWGPPGTSPPEVRRRVYRFSGPGGDSDIVATCKRGFDLLSALVQAFEEAHSTTGRPN